MIPPETMSGSARVVIKYAATRTCSNGTQVMGMSESKVLKEKCPEIRMEKRLETWNETEKQNG
jgi:hypothetical protein